VVVGLLMYVYSEQQRVLKESTRSLERGIHMYVRTC